MAGEGADGPGDVAWEAARPPVPEGSVRRLGQGLLAHRLFGAPLPRLGRFEVVRKLGEGGMGAVFEAVDPRLDRRVAIKVLRDPAGTVAGVDLAHEARMLARLSHPHVVAVHELGEEDGEAYVCMAFVDGPHLGAWLDARRPVAWRAVVRLLSAAARGLAAAHRAGVVHRDFKLENVLVDGEGVPRVTDFGLARAGPAPGALVRPGEVLVGRASKVAGTPGYVAPEVMAGVPADARSDQYSLGVALRNALRRVDGPIPEGLGVVVSRLCADDPGARYPELEAAVAALEAVAARPQREDQRAREVLAARVRALWVAPVREAALASVGFELPLRVEPMGGAGAAGADLGAGGPRAIAEALHRARVGVVLVGAPGAGKTLRLLAVADALLELDAEVDDGTLPVVLSLSSFPLWAGDFGGWLRHEIISKYALPRVQVERWLEDGRLALLLDGLDEVGAAQRQRCVAAIDALRATQPVAYVVTCREAEYRALASPLRADAALRLLPPSPDELGGALERAGAGRLLPVLRRADAAVAEQLCNPLVLGLVAGLTDAEVALDPETLRDRLYARALEHALSHDPPLTPEARDEVVAGLRWLARAARRVGATDLWLEDVQAAWLPTRAQRAAAVGLGLCMVFGVSVVINLGAARVAGLPPLSGWFFGVVAAAAALFIQGSLRVVPMEAMGWSWARVRAWVPWNLALGVATGASHGVFFDFWADLMLGTATGLLGLSVMGLVPRGRERRVNPGDGLVESMRNAVAVAPVIGLVIGVPVGYLVLPFARPWADPGSMYHAHPAPEFAWAVTMGTSAAVTSLFITGMLAPVMHAGIRLVMAATAPLPLRWVPWLDEMSRRGLLHRIGGGWLFRHPTFRDWLAEGRMGAR